MYESIRLKRACAYHLLCLYGHTDIADVLVLPCTLRCYAGRRVRSDIDRAALQVFADNVIEWSVRSAPCFEEQKSRIHHER